MVDTAAVWTTGPQTYCKYFGMFITNPPIQPTEVALDSSLMAAGALGKYGPSIAVVGLSQSPLHVDRSHTAQSWDGSFSPSVMMLPNLVS